MVALVLLSKASTEARVKLTPEFEDCDDVRWGMTSRHSPLYNRLLTLARQRFINAESIVAKSMNWLYLTLGTTSNKGGKSVRGLGKTRRHICFRASHENQTLLTEPATTQTAV